MKNKRREFLKMTCMTGIGLIGTNILAANNKIWLRNNLIRLRGEHLSNLRLYIKEGVRLPETSNNGMKYYKAKDALFFRILNDRNTMVIVVDSMDDLCNSGACPKVSDECRTPQLSSKDRGVAALFGLSLDKEYTTQEVVAAMWKSPENYEELKQEVIKKAFGK